jgi:hypothetical protein
MNPDEVDEFVRVAAIWRSNAFTVPFHNTTAVYKLSTRMSHSCIPNTHILYSADLSCSCRTILPVKAGEELTIEYYPSHRLKSVEERQREFLNSKEFRCHCARCDAGVDDTRRFYCAFPCTHYLLAVPYQVDPDILVLAPCTSCGRTPTTCTRAAMRADEVFVQDFVAQMETSALLSGLDTWDLQRCQSLLRTLNALPVQPYLGVHAHSGPIWRACMDILHRMSALDDAFLHAPVMAGALYADWLETTHVFPSTQLVREYKDTISMALVHAFNEDYRARGRHYALVALRMTLVLYGRDTDLRRSLDSALHTLQWVPPRPHDMSKCAYCEESPSNAAFTLRRCGRCRGVAYCSAGCQKEHWRAHKPHCSDPR